MLHEGDTYPFCINYSAISNCKLKIEEILNLAIFLRFSFSQLRNIRGTCFKYFQKNISGSDTSCPGQISTT